MGKLSTAIEKRKYTYEDYLKTPDDIRYELIEGELIMSPSPLTAHQRISRKIEFELERFVEENDLGEVFDAHTMYVLIMRLSFSPISYLSLKKGWIL